ncbi:MAG: hypothetical protein U0667_06165 [Chloroflexota bacterium]
MTDVPGSDGRRAPDEPDPRPSEAAGVAELIALIDRLEPMLGASGLDEIEVSSGATTLVLRAPLAPLRGVPAMAP